MTVRGFAPPVAFYIATSAPTQGPKGALWSDTSQSPPELMICTATGPVTWADHNGGGGGGSDPLHLDNYLSIGASPATAGPIRMEADTYITSDDGFSTGNPRLIGFSASDQSVRIDPGLYGVVMGSQLTISEAINLHTASGDAQLRGKIDTVVDNALMMYAGTVQIGNALRIFPGFGGIGFYDSDADPTALIPFVDRDEFNNKLRLQLGTLPTSDPNVAGQAYSMDSAGLAAELAAGSRYVLVSNGP